MNSSALPREADLNDLDQLLQLYRQLNPGDPALEAALGRQVFGKILATDGMHVFVLEIDGVLVSTCYLNVILNLTRGTRPYGVIENVVTDENHRNQGYGKQVIQHALQEAWAMGLISMMPP